MNENNTPDWIKKIERDAQNKKPIITEGNMDKKILENFFRKIDPEFDNRFSIFPAGSKKNVIKALEKYHSKWIGIIDKDDWTSEKVEKKSALHPNIKILPRFCIENYFCVPKEIWEAISFKFKEKQEEFQKFADEISRHLPDWTAHGALQRVIHSARQSLLYTNKFPAELDDKPVTDERKIREILKTWHQQLDPDRIIKKYRKELEKAEKRTEYSRLTEYIHGKKFFRQVIIKILNDRLGQKNPDKWIENLLKKMTLPEDMKKFLKKVIDSTARDI